MKKVIVSLLIIILMVAIGVCGWYLWDSLQKEKGKTGDLENRLAKLESTESNNESNKIEEKYSVNGESNNKNTTNELSKVKDFSKSDLITSNGLKLGMSGEEVIYAIKEPTSVESFVEGASGDTITIAKYKNLGLEVTYRASEEDGTLGQISWEKDTIKTARGITVGSTEAEVLAAYPKDSILSNDESDSNKDRVLVIGFPGDDPVYAVNNNGKLVISIENGKVSYITINYGHLN